MNEFIIKLHNILTTKRVSLALAILNLLSIVSGALILVGRTYSLLWDVFGVILLITLFGNLLLVYLNARRINRSTKTGNRLNVFCYFYLIFMIYAMLWIVAGNFLITSSYANTSRMTTRYYGLIGLGYFGIFILGEILADLTFLSLKHRDVWTEPVKANPRKILTIRKVLRIFLGIIAFFTLVLGIYFALITLFGSVLGLQPPELYGPDISPIMAFGAVNGIIGCVVAMFGVSYAFIFLSTTIILLKVMNRKKNPRRSYAIGLIGLVITGVFMMPLFLTPSSVYIADQNFANAFGKDWRNDIPKDIEEKYFLKTQFSTPHYFLGFPPKDCQIKTNITYYKDDDIKLMFDVYMPKEEDKDSPGQNSVMIWIHGGGWTGGDKGNYRIQLNKYFAAQGYIVFDIEYGLYDGGNRLPRGLMTPPENVGGDFDINDMIKHIGIFTSYLVNHSSEYHANTDKIIVSGGSAGGHLTCTVALAIASGDYEYYFPSNISKKVIGYVPYYPGNRLPVLLGIDGKEEFIDPAELVEKDSPPCLIFQGTNDGLVHPSIIQDFKDAYMENDNEECAVLWAPLAGHAADIYFNGYYNMLFLYYMERFLYLAVNNKI